MSFIWPFMLLGLLLLPLLAGYYWHGRRRARQWAAGLEPLVQTAPGSGQFGGGRRHYPPVFYLLGLGLLLVGGARPEMILDLPRVEGTVILAFDVSNSMLADDLKPSRIEAARAAARAFVEQQPPAVRIGVVAFGNGGLVVEPPGDDTAAILSAIDRLDPQGGTSLGQGIFSALNAIAGEAIALDESALEDGRLPEPLGPYPSAIVVLLTDGENTRSPDPLAIAQVAAEAGVRLFPIGIGSPEGAVLPLEGFNVLTQLNEETLIAIADLTNGAYFRAEDAAALQAIYADIDRQLTVRGEEVEVTAIMAGLGLLFLLGGATLSLIWFGRLP